MRGSRVRHLEAKRGRVEIIPMIDVMLFLLVFFIIVTLQMIPDKGILLQLPSSSETQRLAHPQYTVNVAANGTMSVSGKTVTQAELTALLRGDPDPAHTEVTIAASKDVPFQFFVHAMDACHDAGVSDVGVAAQPAPVATP